MKDDKTRKILDSKNSIELEHSKKQSSSNLRLLDRYIKPLKTDWLRPAQVDEVSYKFPECKGHDCQGLRLIHVRTTGRKKLILDYWFNGKAKRHVLPDYDPEHFHVKKIEKYIRSLRDKFGSPDNKTWIKDINVELKREKVEAVKRALTVVPGKTIKEVIEEFYKAGFPKMRNDGTSPNITTIRKQTVYLLGKGERGHSFTLTENEAHNGVMWLKKEYRSWDDVFKKYPSKFRALDLNEDGSTKSKIEFRPRVSLYDSPMILLQIHELTTELVRKFISTNPKPSMQIEMKNALSYIWHFANNKGWIAGTPVNPFEQIKIAKPRQTHMTKWNKKEFTQEQQSMIFSTCEDLKKKYPGQPELFQLALITGRRISTLLKLRWSNIEFKETLETYTNDLGKDIVIKYFGKINVSGSANKTDHEDKIPITKTIKNILDSLLHVRNTIKPWHRFIDWVFVSPRVPNKQFLRKGSEDNSFNARLKDPRNCWKDLVAATGLEGDAMQKMFRTTYQNKVERLKGVNSSWDAITVTGQNDTRAHEKHYLNKKLTPKVLHHFQQLDEEFSAAFKTRKNN